MDDVISVGIPVAGQPRLEQAGEYVRLKNMLIGKNFHWQRSIEVLLPGEVSLSGCPDFPVINRLPVETYLECVVGSEMNPAAPAEFLKAHAIISRSWALGKIRGLHPAGENGKCNSPLLILNWEDTADHHGFDVCSDDHCQRYQGVQPIPEAISRSIRETAGLALYAPDGSLVDARFSKCCGGTTELFSSCWQPRELPCLESFEDPWCDLSSLPADHRKRILDTILKDYDLLNDGGFSWQTYITTAEIKENLRAKFGHDIGEIRNISVTARGASGRATRLRLEGSEGSIVIGKELMIRRLLAPTHLYSSWIDIVPRKPHPDTYLIRGRGWGHGVGLCQIGAARMALEGRDHREILAFYYPGSVIR